MNPRTEVVRCRDVTGRLRDITLTDNSEFVSPGAALEQRIVLAQQKRLIRKFVSRQAGRRDPRLYTLLDNEIRAGARLGQVYTEEYPPEIARLVAYNVDVEEPFALLRDYSGEPVVSAVKGFDEDQRRQFDLSLLRAVQLVGAAGVVHGAVNLNAIRWDGRRVQLVDFEWAERAGEPRRHGGPRPRTPEQLAGTGLVDVRDDVWAAGRVVRRNHLGASADSSWPDRSRDPERLRSLLSPVFDNPAEQRPHAVELLAKLRVRSPLPHREDPEEAFRAGRKEFDEAGLRKRGPQPAGATAEHTGNGQTARKNRRRFPFRATTLLALLTAAIR